MTLAAMQSAVVGANLVDLRRQGSLEVVASFGILDLIWVYDFLELLESWQGNIVETHRQGRLLFKLVRRN